MRTMLHWVIDARYITFSMHISQVIGCHGKNGSNPQESEEKGTFQNPISRNIYDVCLQACVMKSHKTIYF
jgi:hypothetical protein